MRRQVVIKPTSTSNAGALVLIFLLAAAALTIAIINRVEYAPTVSPTASPTVSPTAAPTSAPTSAPTASPTVAFYDGYATTFPLKYVDTEPSVAGEMVTVAHTDDTVAGVKRLQSTPKIEHAFYFKTESQYRYQHTTSSDRDGNAYVFFSFKNTITVGEFTLTTTDNEAIGIAKVNTTGHIVWAIQSGTIGTNLTTATTRPGMAFDCMGNLYVTVAIYYTATFGPFEVNYLGGDESFAIVKISPDGEWLNAIAVDNTAYVEPGDIAVDCNGNVYVVAAYTGLVDFGHTTLNTDTYSDTFVAQLLPNFTWGWIANTNGTAPPNSTYGYTIGLDEANNVYIGSQHYYSAYYGDIFVDTPTTPNSVGFTIAKIDRSGTWVWVIPAYAQTNPNSYPRGIAVTPSGIVYMATSVSGNTPYTMTIGNVNVAVPKVSTAFSRNVILTKISPLGTVVWARAVATEATNNFNPLDLAMDCKENLYLSFTGYAIDIDGIRLQPTLYYYPNTYLAKISPEGNFIWIEQFTSNNRYNYADAVSVDDMGNIYVVGHFEINIAIGEFEFTEPFGVYLYFARLRAFDTGVVGYLKEPAAYGDIVPVYFTDGFVGTGFSNNLLPGALYYTDRMSNITTRNECALRRIGLALDANNMLFGADNGCPA